jgi:hypothetical protein
MPGKLLAECAVDLVESAETRIIERVLVKTGGSIEVVRNKISKVNGTFYQLRKVWK